MNDEQRALRDAVRGLLEKRSPEARVRELMATETGYDETTWQELADMGLLGLAVDEAHGGAGAGHAELGIVMEEMGRALLCAPYLSSAVLVPALLRALGDDADTPARIAAGSCLATVAYAEGMSVRVPERPATVATRGADGWRLRGEKNYVLDGASADVFYVLADTDAGASVFAVVRDAPGLLASPLSTVDLTRKLCALTLRDTPGRLIGEIGAGAAALESTLESGGLALAGEQAGGAQRAMRMGAEYAGTRFQFARAIGSFQAVKHMCADMLLEAESAVSAARHVAAAYDADDPGRAADLALAQAYCSDAYVSVAATNIQVHGGIGFTWEHPAHLYLRRARGAAQLFGSAAVHRERYLQLKGV